jgi:hypothetical protein
MIVDRSKNFSVQTYHSDTQEFARNIALGAAGAAVGYGGVLTEIEIYGTLGSMTREALSLPRLIVRHNDQDDDFHLNEHQLVCRGHQFEDDVTFIMMTISTVHHLTNMS